MPATDFQYNGNLVTGESIIYFAKEWSEDPTSCNHVFQQLARGNRVLWVNSISMRNPNLASARDLKKIFRKLRMCLGGLKQVGPTAWLYQPMVIPLPHSELAQKFNRILLRWSLLRQARRLGMKKPQLWSFIPNTGYMVGHLDESVVVYYCVDAWSEYPTQEGRKMAEQERDLLKKADVCFATSQRLLDDKQSQNPNSYLALHGVNHEHFARALDPGTIVPEDLAGLPRPVLGYFGLIYRLTDFDLLKKIARAHPEWSLALIGKVQVDVEELKTLPNVHLLGHRPYETLPSYCKGFDLGLLPYVQNEWIRNANPIKMREYLSAGLPVVSVDMPEVSRYSHLVSIAQNHDEFIALVERALREDTPRHRRERSEAMRSETWEVKVAQVAGQVMRSKAAKSA